MDTLRLHSANGDSQITAPGAPGLSELILVGGVRSDDFRVAGDPVSGLGMDPGSQVILAGGQGDFPDTFRLTPDPAAEFLVAGWGSGPNVFGSSGPYALPGYSSEDPSTGWRSILPLPGRGRHTPSTCAATPATPLPTGGPSSSAA